MRKAVVATVLGSMAALISAASGYLIFADPCMDLDDLSAECRTDTAE